ncbi:MAG: hypothetical protein ABJG88_08635 [Litorimonas sp.]
MSKSKWIIGFVSAATLLIGANASATTLEELSFGEMVDSAHACVMGRAVKATVFERDGQIYTETRFRVTQTAFGQTNTFINVITPGGEKKMGGLVGVEVVAGATRFFDQSSSLLLLTPTETGRRGRYDIVGFNQGQFAVIGDNVTLPVNVGGVQSVEKAFEMINVERSTSSSNEISE